MIVLAFEDEAAPAGRLAQALGVPLHLIEVHAFPDGEVLPTVKAAAHTVLYRSLDRPNGKIMPLLLAADAARRAGAERLELVCPYLAYLRQDAVFAPGQPLSLEVICGLLGRAFDRVVTVDAHLHRVRDLSPALGVPALDLSAAEPLADAIGGGDGLVIVGPDRESTPWARRIAERLGAEMAVFTKVREGDRKVRLDAPDLAAVRGRRAVIVDDIASSGTTLTAAAERLGEAGAASIEVAVVHALFGPGAEAAIRAAGVSRIVSTDAVAHPTNAATLAELLAGALQ